MKHSAFYLNALKLAILVFSTMLVVACDRDEEQSAEPETAGQPETASVVAVEAFDYGFEAPDELPSGWSTFRVKNAGAQEHFMLLWRLPEGFTFEDWEAEVPTAFDEPMQRYEAGELDQAEMLEALFEAIPEWFAEARQFGGVALLSPGRSGETTVRLEPGNYVMECYVKSPDGQFHASRGMIRGFMVTDEASDADEPEADVELTISNAGMTVDGEFVPGRQTVRVSVTEAPEGLLGHDAHLVRLDGDTELDEVIGWMDWIDAYRAPGPGEFLGGAEDMPAGSTAYVTVDLEPGEYAWVSESYAEQGVVTRFTVE